MPNYCEHDFYIEGKPSDVSEIMKEIGSIGKYIDFNSLLPYPSEYEERDEIKRKIDGLTIEEANAILKINGIDQVLENNTWEFKDGFNMGGIDWRRNNWGTKWNASSFENYDIYEGEESAEISFSFTTAWCPPMPIFHKLAELTEDKSLKITISYFERGMEFSGRVKIDDGVLKHEEAKYFGKRGG